jgi:hypothetical protein
MLELLVQFFAPWASVYGDSAILSTGIPFVHLAGILFGGGRALVADGLVLRSPSLDRFKTAGHLGFLRDSHRDVITGLTVAAIAGGLMVTADLRHFLETPLYYVKMGTVLLLLGNGVRIRSLEASLAAGGESGSSAWPKARGHAAASAVLWLAIVAMGLALKN